MSTLGLVVVARMDSRRLPGKSLELIGSRPLIGHVLDRMSRVPDCRLVIATSQRTVDDPIAAYSESEGVEVFRGNAHDVTLRLYECAEAHGFDIVIRICGDSPFIDPNLVETARHCFEEYGSEIVTNVCPRTFPPGMSVEVLPKATLRRILDETDDPDDREHVTHYVYRNADKFDLYNFEALDDRYAGVKLTVDEPDDLIKARRVANALGVMMTSADIDKIVETLRELDPPVG